MVVQHANKNRFRFSEHPWLSYFSLSIILIMVIIIAAVFANAIGVPSNAPWRSLVVPTLPHILVLFVIAPLVLRIPHGKRRFVQYLKDIRLANIQPFFPLLFLGISTSFLMLLSLLGTSFLFRLVQGMPFNHSFFSRILIHLQGDLPSHSMSYVVAFPSIFEEISCRGIFLAQFRRKYSERMSILITALTFGGFHIINLIFGGDPLFVFQQIIFGSFAGLFYGYMVLRVNSLLPAMMFHYLVNLFMGSCLWYLNTYGSPLAKVTIMTLNLIVIVPVLMLWVHYVFAKLISIDDDGSKSK